MNRVLKYKNGSKMILWFLVGVIFFLSINLFFWRDYQSINATTMAVVSSLLFSMTLSIWNYESRIFFILLVGMLFFGGLPLINLLTGYAVTPGVIINNLGIGLILVSAFLMLLYLFQNRRGGVASIMTFSIVLLGGALMFMVLPFWLYFIVSHEALRADIVLTVYQTNYHEALSYIAGQSKLYLVIAVIVVLLFVYGYIKFLQLTKSIDHTEKSKKLNYLVVGFIIMGIFYGYKYFVYYEVNTVINRVAEAVHSYEAFRDNREIRLQRLAQLKGLYQDESKKGVYVLVIGESQARDHMGIYGYSRQTTPWLTGLKEKNETLLFRNAYSNHVHTVPSLTYALSEKNQYNIVSLAEANSIIDMANAANMDTYWISNQERYSVFDTPVAEIASMAKHQIWINDNIGNTAETRFHDGMLVEKLPNEKEAKNALIVVHVMGSHVTYRERYPSGFTRFSDGDKLVDNYDNAIFYGDDVLGKIYNKMKNNPNFMGFIFFSDHGEEPQGNLAHESSKFTFNMARIPLIMNFSDTFIRNNPETFNRLRLHEDYFWTNDLLYNMMISILGIEGAPIVEPQLDLSNDTYDRTKNNLTTLHGEKRIVDDNE